MARRRTRWEDRLVEIITNIVLPPPQTRRDPFTAGDFTYVEQSPTLQQQELLRSGFDAVVEDCRNMYENDPRIHRSIENVTYDIMSGGFEFDGANANLIRRIMTDSGYMDSLDQYIKYTLIDGNTFIVLREENKIVNNTIVLPVLKVLPNKDDYGQWNDLNEAYFYYLGQRGQGSSMPFPLFELIHARYDINPYSLFGTPLYASSRLTSRQLADGIGNMYIRRQMESNLRYMVDLGPYMTRDDFLESNQQSFDDTQWKQGNRFLFIRDGVNVSELRSDTAQNQIADLDFLQSMLMVGSPTPPTLLGLDKHGNQYSVRSQLRQYEKTVNSMRQWTIKQFLVPFIQRQLLIMGKKNWQNAVQVYAPAFNTSDVFEFEAGTRALALAKGAGFIDEEIGFGMMREMLPTFRSLREPPDFDVIRERSGTSDTSGIEPSAIQNASPADKNTGPLNIDNGVESLSILNQQNENQSDGNIKSDEHWTQHWRVAHKNGKYSISQEVPIETREPESTPRSDEVLGTTMAEWRRDIGMDNLAGWLENQYKEGEDGNDQDNVNITQGETDGK